MFPTPPSLETVRSCWEVPYIAHFCSLFKKYLDIPTFDTEDLEQALIEDPEKEGLLPELITRLLRKADITKEVSTYIGINTFEPFLKTVINNYNRRDNSNNPYLNHEETEFNSLPVDIKIKLVKQLCDIRIESKDIQDIIESANPDSLRVIPLGYDSSVSAYYYFFGTRLYKESNAFPRPPVNGETPNNSVLNSTAASETTLDSSSLVNFVQPKWELVCQTEEDWIEVTGKLAKSKKSKSERALVKILEENFLPNISKLFNKKQREEQFDINKYVPLRSSSRIKVLTETKVQETKKEIESIRNKYSAPFITDHFYHKYFSLNDKKTKLVKIDKRRSAGKFNGEDEENDLKRAVLERSLRASRRSRF